ncbi:MAG: ribosome biogenesis GTPase Der [Candidatus Liberibacter ctenarytainae]|uniref:GTPase Der n=1 Tax=Candidatus Liberibacter ctenarytainae TaxID=2020335 RepID=A0A937DL32_9HYPH|nr:ribosome biogenesis GTPase Der [Candidatus Liberibacter ctenarytainae]
MVYTIAIVGSPNVGKSTLFNRLVKRKMAIVGNRPGITRDRLYETAHINGFECNIIDTAGINIEDSDLLAKEINNQTENALCEADLALFVIDSKAGVTPYDHLIAKFLRKKGIPIVVVANKMETRISQSNFYDIFSFGFDTIVEISAEHGQGISDLCCVIIKYLEKKYPHSQPQEPDNSEKIDEFSDKRTVTKNKYTNSSHSSPKPLRIAIVGRPNVGKSTLINHFLGYNRLLAGSQAGMTRDSITVSWNWRNHPIEMLDTAGIRKPARIIEPIEKLSVSKSLKSMRICETTIVVLDATMPFEKQDLRIIDSSIKTGRAAILAFNKWDKVTNKPELLQELQEKAINNLPQVGRIRTATISGYTGEGLDDLMSAVLEINELWKTRILTARLNSWLGKIQIQNPPPAVSGRYHRIKYITQIKSSPPSFILFCTSPQAISESYKRYLMNKLRIDFSLSGIPIRIRFRSSKNPYV